MQKSRRLDDGHSSLKAIERVSENARAVLGCEGTLIGRSVNDFVGQKLLHDLRNALATVSTAARSAPLLDVACGERTFDIATHRYKSAVIIEFEPAPSLGQPLHTAREMIGRISDMIDVERLAQRAGRIVAGATGYDRVMSYRFEQDGSGKVVSETKRADLESFFGQYFPASDIPQQARPLKANFINEVCPAGRKASRVLPIRLGLLNPSNTLGSEQS